MRSFSHTITGTAAALALLAGPAIAGDAVAPRVFDGMPDGEQEYAALAQLCKKSATNKNRGWHTQEKAGFAKEKAIGPEHLTQRMKTRVFPVFSDYTSLRILCSSFQTLQ